MLGKIAKAAVDATSNNLDRNAAWKILTFDIFGTKEKDLPTILGC